MPYDPAQELDTPDGIVEYLAAAFETGDSCYIVHAIGVAAKAKGMSYIAERTGLNRQSTYRAFGKKGNPQLDTVIKVLRAFGVDLSAKLFLKPENPFA